MTMLIFQNILLGKTLGYGHWYRSVRNSFFNNKQAAQRKEKFPWWY